MRNNDKKKELLMHKLNLYEVLYDTWRSQGETTAKNIIDAFQNIISGLGMKLYF